MVWKVGWYSTLLDQRWLSCVSDYHRREVLAGSGVQAMVSEFVMLLVVNSLGSRELRPCKVELKVGKGDNAEKGILAVFCGEERRKKKERGSG